MKLRCGKFTLSLDRPLIMGIVNLTPDSFSGDGHGNHVERALAHARLQIEAGADILDIGAESTRPGAQATPLDEELRRLIPVVEALSSNAIPVSVDTYKPEVMRAALNGGASMINDIFGLRMPGALEVLAQSDCAVCLMHMQGEPLIMQTQPRYGNVVEEVRDFLKTRVDAALAAGIAKNRLLLDPGFGFGKTVAHNFSLLKHLPDCTFESLPLLAGLSRKSMLGAVTGRAVEERLPASLAAALIALQGGAHILRVHDVAATRDAVSVWQATRLAD